MQQVPDTPPLTNELVNRYTKILGNYYDIDYPRVFLEGGTNNGLAPDMGMILYKKGWKSINIEPEPAAYRSMCRNRPNGTNFQVALSDTCNNEVSFTITEWPGNSSLKHNQLHVDELNSYKSGYEEIKVKTVTWKRLLERNDISRVDLAIIDTEGHELKVIAGMKDSLVMPNVISTEFGYSDPNNYMLDKNGTKNFSGIFALSRALKRRGGYTFDFVAGNNAYFSRNVFWPNGRPKYWHGESESFSWRGCLYYDKSITGSLRTIS